MWRDLEKSFLSRKVHNADNIVQTIIARRTL